MMDGFAEALLAWFDRHGRHELPWQRSRNAETPADAYRVWVSEIMLQQTQVTTVIPYFQRFLARFPDVSALAAADLDEILHHWTGLGYYARGRHLHAAARIVVAQHAGRLPEDVDALCRLPGIGRSTAGAIAAIAYGRPASILDGNVKRVLARYHAVPGYPGDSATQRLLWRHAESHTPDRRVGDYTQAIMDLGATLCTRRRPACERCPVAPHCLARQHGAVDEFPHRKVRAAKPVRAARLFVVRDPAGRCLLEQRPHKGVWGGLWTPPERPTDTTVDGFCQEFRIPPNAVAATRSGPHFRHTFTHFHLDIEPVFVRLDRSVHEVTGANDVCWYGNTPTEQPELGLSAPAARLLADDPLSLEVEQS